MEFEIGDIEKRLRAVELEENDHRNEIGSLKHRVSGVEEKQAEIVDLTCSVRILASNMENMIHELEKQGERLVALESAPAEDSRYIRRMVITSVLTTVIGAVLGAVMTFILK